MVFDPTSPRFLTRLKHLHHQEEQGWASGGLTGSRPSGRGPAGTTSAITATIFKPRSSRHYLRVMPGGSHHPGDSHDLGIARLPALFHGDSQQYRLWLVES